MMNGINWYSIIVTIGLVVLGFITSYIKTKSNVLSKITGFISKAEAVYKNVTGKGCEKHELVINWCWALVPVPLKPFITRDFIAHTIDTIFDEVKDYSEMQLDKIADKIG